MISRIPKRSLGYSTMETVIAALLLGVILVSIGKFSNMVRGGIYDRQLAMQIEWEIENARETIGSWQIDSVTAAEVEQLPISDELRSHLENPYWQCVVTELQLPAVNQQKAEVAAIVGKSIQLQLRANYLGQSIKPVERTFFVLPKSLVLAEPSEQEGNAE